MGLKIENLTKKFGDFTAINNINFSINKGEFLAILGPSGCGKTTMLRIIAGFEKTTDGTVSYDNQVLTSKDNTVPVEKRSLGMVFQSFALWPHMTVREHVEFPLKSKRCKMNQEEKKKAADEAIEAMRLTSMQDRYPGQLSGGQRQRVALARAIVEKPQILLMDEPLSALDAELKMSMRREIQDIHRLTNATIVYITHDQSEALALADKIIIMKDGEIEQMGTPEEIYQNPKTEFVATFVSKSNLMEGEWENDIFHSKDGKFIVENKKVDEYFKNRNICPVRPDEIIITKDTDGTEGVVVNRQYNGRENHYTVKAGDVDYKIYSSDTEYHTGDKVYLKYREAI
ncbi:ABC transporter ATP-binding protein [Peptacetobacter hominis]|uniref:ABC-type quaternary amine transporter n=1 Tax=Peptacetobacter hominis TaxID=2743610 RepID=A0A544QUI2_9FIRM|nr:ABC transporter ATP-binding protein [Peptacetobacter hominis]TQQ84368.1 ABC transporter ATP-binding protein [Peptacetobacter hominis]